MRVPWKVKLAIPIVAVLSTTSAAAVAQQQFVLSGSATLQRDLTPLRSDRFTLRATLDSADSALSKTPGLLEGRNFVMSAKLVSAAEVCYNDTIFRDDFDGDGF